MEGAFSRCLEIFCSSSCVLEDSSPASCMSCCSMSSESRNSTSCSFIVSARQRAHVATASETHTEEAQSFFL